VLCYALECSHNLLRDNRERIGRKIFSLICNKYSLQKREYWCQTWEPVIVVCVVHHVRVSLSLSWVSACTRRRITSTYGISIPVTYYIARPLSSQRGRAPYVENLTDIASSRVCSVIRSFLNFIYFRRVATVIVTSPSSMPENPHTIWANTKQYSVVSWYFATLCILLPTVDSDDQCPCWSSAL
jgi:hypothetical protein